MKPDDGGMTCQPVTFHGPAILGRSGRKGQCEGKMGKIRSGAYVGKGENLGEGF